MIILETDRLIIRRLELDDTEFLVNILNQPSFLQYIGDKGVRNEEDAVRYLETGAFASYRQFGFGQFLVELKETGKPIGMCGLLKRETLPDVDLGFAFLPDYWSRGYAFEAASAMIDYGREAFGLKRIMAITSPDNEASMNLLGKLGLKFEGMIKLTEDQPEVRLFGSNL